jgi:hypothetical protein
MTQVTKKVERTSLGLRNALFDELDDLRAGASTPARANAVANVCKGILDIAEAERSLTPYPAVKAIELDG